MKDSKERDKNGHLTDWALAFDALGNHGCDCGEDEEETCLACLCEKALKSERKKVSEALMMSVVKKCEKLHIQCCSECPRFDCGDNLSPAKKVIRDSERIIQDLVRENKNLKEQVEHWKKRFKNKIYAND